MNRNTKRLFAFFCLTLTLLSIALALSRKNMVYEQNMAPINNIGNTNNGGILFKYEDELYGRVVPATDGTGYFSLSCKRKDGTEIVLESGHDVSNVVVYNGIIYYRNTDIVVPYFQVDYSHLGVGAIYALNIEGKTNSVRLTEEYVDNFYIYNDKIYFQVGDQEKNSDGNYTYITRIYCCSLDGKNKQLLYSYATLQSWAAGLFSIYDSSLFLPTENNVIKYQLKTKEETTCISSFPYDMKLQKVISAIPFSDRIFVSVQMAQEVENSCRVLCEVDASGKLSVLSNTTLSGFTCDESHIYYSESGKLYVLDLKDDTIYETKFEIWGKPIIIDNKIYYLETHNHGGTAAIKSVVIPETEELKTEAGRGTALLSCPCLLEAMRVSY